jgi:hypothetical protein
MGGIQDLSKAFSQGHLVARLALPDDCDLPFETGKRFRHRSVAGNVASELGLPILNVGCRARRRLAVRMAMPITAMDQERHATGREDEVRPTGQVFPMKAEAVAEAMREPAHAQLGFRVGAPHAPHDRASLLSGEDVRHAAMVAQRRCPSILRSTSVHAIAHLAVHAL